MTIREALRFAREQVERWLEVGATIDPPGQGLEASPEEAAAWAEARRRAGHIDPSTNDNNSTGWLK